MTSLTIAHAGPDFALMQWGSILVAKSAAFSEVGPAAKWVLDASGLGKDEREPDQLALAIARARKTLPAR